MTLIEAIAEMFVERMLVEQSGTALKVSEFLKELTQWEEKCNSKNYWQYSHNFTIFIFHCK